MKITTSVPLLLSVLVSACSADSKSRPHPAADNTTLDPITGGPFDSATNGDLSLELPMRWTLGPATYGEGAITWQRSGADRTVLFIGTPPNDSKNGDYAGSSITLLFSGSGSASGSGSDYFVVDNISNSAANGVNGVVNIVVTAGLERVPLASSRWTSNNGVISVTIDSLGQLHVSTPEPLILTRDFNQGTGVPDSPDHISFEMQNLHGIELCDEEGKPNERRFC